MTRQHAHELVFGKCKNWEGKQVAAFLDALEAFGLLKFDEEKSPVIEINNMVFSLLSVRQGLFRAGYLVVEKLDNNL